MTPRHRRLPFLVTIITLSALVAAACSSPDDADPAATTTSGATTPTTAPRSAATFEKAACADVVHLSDIEPDGVMTCGHLVVPENRALPNGRKVRLAVVRLLSHAPKPAADPVVYLHGGPGIPTLPDGLGSRLSSPVLDTRDLILFDQRGSGRSDPDLQCPERERAFIDALATPSPFAKDLAAFDTATKACYERLTASGVDLDQYDTEQNAADLADLRIAMGIAQWNLWGVSYGTRLALATMRSHPEGIRSVVLDSVYAPSAGTVDEIIESSNEALSALVNGCRTDSACHAAFPDVAGDVQKVIDRLDRRPFTFSYRPPGSPRSRQLHITGEAAAGGMFNVLYSTELIAQLPSFIHQLARGDNSVVAPMAETAIPFVNEVSEGAYMSFECADNGAKIDEAKVAALRLDPGRASIGLLAGWNLFCKNWPVKPLPANFSDVVHSDIPTLVIAGEYDPTTPASGSKAAAQALSHSVFVEVPRGGHAPDSQCSSAIFARFLDALERVPTPGA